MIKERDEPSKVSFVFRDPPAAQEDEDELEFEASSQHSTSEDSVVEEKEQPQVVPASLPEKAILKSTTTTKSQSQSVKTAKEPKLVNKHPQSTKAYEDQISDLKNIVKTLAENLQTEHVKVSNLEREMFEKEGIKDLFLKLLIHPRNIFASRRRETSNGRGTKASTK